MNEDIELIRLYDEIADKEKPTPEVPNLSTFKEEEGKTNGGKMAGCVSSPMGQSVDLTTGD